MKATKTLNKVITEKETLDNTVVKKKFSVINSIIVSLIIILIGAVTIWDDIRMYHVVNNKIDVVSAKYRNLEPQLQKIMPIINQNITDGKQQLTDFLDSSSE